MTERGRGREGGRGREREREGERGRERGREREREREAEREAEREGEGGREITTLTQSSCQVVPLTGGGMPDQLSLRTSSENQKHLTTNHRTTDQTITTALCTHKTTISGDRENEANFRLGHDE